MKHLQLYKRVLSLNPLISLIIALVISLFLVALSIIFQVDSYIPNDKVVQRGYLLAINWAFNYTIIAPLIIFFVISSIRDSYEIGNLIQEKGMLVNKEFEVIKRSSDIYREVWRKKMYDYEKVAFILSICAILGSVCEWWFYSGAPLLRGVPVPEGEIDWSVKYIDGTRLEKISNAAFSLIVFLMQGFIIAVAFYFITLIAALSVIIPSLQKGRHYLIPDLKSKDIRLGFEIFENTALSILWTAVFGYAMFYLSRLWNAYMQTEGGYASLFDFVIVDIFKGFAIRSTNTFTGMESLFAIGSFAKSGVLVTFGSFILFSLCVILMIKVFRDAASNAKAKIERKIDDIKNIQYQSNISNMKIWPLYYPRLNELLLLGFFALISVVFFRVGLFYIGIIIFIILRQLFEGSLRLFPKKP